MSLRKKLVSTFLDLYLLPVKSSPKLKRYVKEVSLIDEGEHLSKPVEFLKSHHLFSERPVVIDIGGANGDTTSFFLKTIPDSRIFTFEANPQSAEEIKNKFTNADVKVFALALSDREGVLSFHVTDNSLSSSYKNIADNNQFQTIKSIDVPAKTLDAVMENEKDISFVDILKLDVQGAELDVLRGAKKTLAKSKLLIVEQSVRSPYVGGSMYYEVDEFLRGEGFNLLDIIITYRKDGEVLTEFDSLYLHKNYKA